MSLFNNATPALINSFNKNTLMETLQIEYTEVGNDYLVARMPVAPLTHQPMGLLHGGASVALAESLGSIASFLLIEDKNKYAPVGLEINANHIKGVTQGYVYGRCTPVHIGKRTQIWDIKISTETGELVCVSRLTVMIIERK
jgi:1,4-dihydroxy-2-naphthoyl-CoA hydrolase